MKLSLLLMLLLQLIIQYNIAVPLVGRREEQQLSLHQEDSLTMSGEKEFLESSGSINEQDDTYVPDYMEDLYKCWQKDEENDMKRCLKSVDEILQVDEIVKSTNTITGFIGQGISANTTNEGPQYQKVTFNISCVKPYEDIQSSELRFYKEGVDSKTLDLLSSNICQLNEGIMVSLLAAELISDGQDHVIQSVVLSRETLMKDEWIVFHNFKSLFVEWIQEATTNHLQNRTFKLVLQGGCAGLHPEEIGFRFKEQPLLVLFLKNQDTTVDRQVIEHIAKMTSEVRRRRQLDNAQTKASTSQFCQLQHYNVNFSTLGWNKFIIGPKQYQANYCAGECSYPLADNQNGTLHSQIISFAHYKEPHTVPEPCCVPTKLVSQSLIVKLDKLVIQIKTYPGMVAQYCGCR